MKEITNSSLPFKQRQFNSWMRCTIYILVVIILLSLGSCSEPTNNISTDSNSETEELLPDIPANLLVNGATTSTLNVSWDSSAAATNYKLYKDTEYPGTFSQLVYDGTDTSFQDTGLDENTVYYYKVCAANEYGESALSLPKYGITLIDTSAPPIPRNITVTDITENSAIISWSSSEGADSYELYRSVHDQSFFYFLSNPNTTSFTDTGLASGETYYYKIRSVRNGYKSDFSTIVSINTLGPPIPPNLLSVGDPTYNSLTISWESVPDATSYKIYRAFIYPDYSDSYSELANTTATSYIDTTVGKGWVYYYKISAINSYGEGEKSSYLSGRPLEGEIALTTDDGTNTNTYMDADMYTEVNPYGSGDIIIIATNLYEDDANNTSIGMDFELSFYRSSTGVISTESLKYGLSQISSISCVVNLSTYGSVGERIVGTFSSQLEDGKDITGSFSVLRM